MQIKTLPKFGLVLFLVIAAFIFSFRAVNALVLPVKAGLGQTCSATNPCESRFFCSDWGKCVQCIDNSVCDERLNESCVNYVCTLPEGNNIGDLCTNTRNCKSGLRCGVKGICEEVGSVTPSASITPSVSVAPAGGEGNWMGMDLSIQDVFAIINGLACWLTRIATAIMVIFLVIAGLRFMYARGNPTAYESAKKNFQHVLIGILVIMAVYVIIATVANAVGVTDFSFVPLKC